MCFYELQKLASLMKTKDLQMLQNVTIWWILNEEPFSSILKKSYCTLIEKMDLDMTSKGGKKPFTRTTLKLLTNVG